MHSRCMARSFAHFSNQATLLFSKVFSLSRGQFGTWKSQGRNGKTLRKSSAHPKNTP